MFDGMMMLIVLIGMHFLADFALQGDFMAKAKDHNKPIVGVPSSLVLGGHAWIHGMFVAVITGVWWLFVPEFLIHAYTDGKKCDGKISFKEDQLIHLGCKIVWFIIATMVTL